MIKKLQQIPYSIVYKNICHSYPRKSKNKKILLTLIALWNSVSNTSEYAYVSDVMKKLHGEFSFGNEVDTDEGDSVFTAWCKKAEQIFYNNDSYGKTVSFLKRLKDDVDWWNLYQGFVGADFRYIAPMDDSSKNLRNNSDLYEKWCNIWLNIGAIKDKTVINTFLTSSILNDNVNILNKLNRDYNIDINEEFTVNISNTYSLNEFELYLWVERNKFRTVFDNRVRLGFFVKSERMAIALSNIGFNWSVRVFGIGGKSLDGVPILSAIQNREDKSFLSMKERTKIINFVYSQQKNIIDVKAISHYKITSILEAANKRVDIDMALNGVSWWKIRMETGENFAHMLAKHAPRLLTNYISSSKNGISLMSEKDNKGVLPIEYFLCFSDTITIKKHLNKLLRLEKKYSLPKPDWLKVKTLVVENSATYSGVDSILNIYPTSIWKQRVPEDFKKSLKSKSGQKFVEMATNFKYMQTPSNQTHELDMEYDSLYYGLCITEYLRTNGDEEKLINLAETKNEVQLYLIQTWRMFFALENAPNQCYQDGWNRKRVGVKNNIEALTNKAIELGMDVIYIKNQTIQSYCNEDINNFNEIMSNGISSWSNMQELIEREKLMSMVTKNVKKHAVTKQNIGLAL